GLAAPPASGGAGVQVAGVHDPGDERPGLLGIPAPVPAPGLVRPDRPGDDRERPDREREDHGPVGEPVQGIGTEEPAAHRADPGPRNAMTAAQVIAMTNSYMLPHGTRCSAIPRVRMPRTWVARPITVRPSAARTQGPAGAPPARQRLGAASTGPAPAVPLAPPP